MPRLPSPADMSLAPCDLNSTPFVTDSSTYLFHGTPASYTAHPYPERPVSAPVTDLPHSSSHLMSIDNLVHTNVAVTLPSVYPAVECSRHIEKSDRTTTLQLGGSLILTFSPDDVPNPPALRLIDEDLGTLIRWWDDASTDWDPTGYSFTINNTTIALKYWKQIYNRYRRWKANKNRWHLWKVC